MHNINKIWDYWFTWGTGGGGGWLGGLLTGGLGILLVWCDVFLLLKAILKNGIINRLNNAYTW